VVLAHGLEGSPHGRKATALRAAGVPLVCPDHRKQVLAQRVASLRRVVAEHPGCVLVGSSYGGLASMAVLPEVMGHVAHLVLLAPALHWLEAPVSDLASLVVPPSLPAWVVHGRDDRKVPHEVSEALVRRSPHVRLTSVDDGHSLVEALPLIVEGIVAIASDDGSER
jgi:pimeloyl-ACP methyl ester carboxylesterase